MKKIVNGVSYTTLELLGHGKGGYSYLAKGPDGLVILKQIHHEPCPYYAFGNKIEAELHDYQRLLEAGIRTPKLIDFDKEQEVIIKEFIDGETIDQLIKDKKDISIYIPQVKEMAELAKKANLNIDYYPTNFIPYNGILYYIDYECNDYSDEWSFDNWGSKYWSN